MINKCCRDKDSHTVFVISEHSGNSVSAVLSLLHPIILSSGTAVSSFGTAAELTSDSGLLASVRKGCLSLHHSFITFIFSGKALLSLSFCPAESSAESGASARAQTVSCLDFKTFCPICRSFGSSLKEKACGLFLYFLCCFCFLKRQGTFLSEHRG